MNTGETVGFVMENALLVPTVAEGVETMEQLNAHRSMGCDIAQGYYFSKPVPPEQYEFFIEQRMRIEEEIDPMIKKLEDAERIAGM